MDQVFGPHRPVIIPPFISMPIGHQHLITLGSPEFFHHVQDTPGQFQIGRITCGEIGIHPSNERGFELIEQAMGPPPAIVSAPPFPIHVLTNVSREPHIVWEDAVVLFHPIHPCGDIILHPGSIGRLTCCHEGIEHQTGGRQIQRNVSPHHPGIHGIQNPWKTLIIDPGQTVGHVGNVRKGQGIMRKHLTVSHPVFR